MKFEGAEKPFTYRWWDEDFAEIHRKRLDQIMKKNEESFLHGKLPEYIDEDGVMKLQSFVEQQYGRSKLMMGGSRFYQKYSSESEESDEKEEEESHDPNKI